MDIHPPIEDRTTEQLIEIIETQERWRKDVLALAKNELTKRGITLEQQSEKRKKRVRRESNYKRRIRAIKERATYTSIEKFLIVLLGPILVIVFRDIFMFHAGEGYKKKNRQGFFYLILGIGLWVLVMYLLN